MCRTFQPVAMTLGLGSGHPLFAQTAWTCTTHGIFWASRPDTSPDSHARITCVYCSATSAYMPDITASGKRGKEEKDGQTTFFAISHNDIIKNFNECQANFPFLQNYLEWRLLLFASFQYFLIMRFLPAVMLPTYRVSLSRSFSYS